MPRQGLVLPRRGSFAAGARVRPMLLLRSPSDSQLLDLRLLVCVALDFLSENLLERIII